MPAAHALALHPQRQLGQLTLRTGIAIGLIQRAHGGKARRTLPRHQAQRFDLAMIRGWRCTFTTRTVI